MRINEPSPWFRKLVHLLMLQPTDSLTGYPTGAPALRTYTGWHIDLFVQKRLQTVVVLACIIRKRPASDDFAWQKIAWEDEGSVKLLCGTWRQALQAYTIKAATILGRGFPLLSVGSG